MREIEKGLKRFDASLEWFMGRISLREQEMEEIRSNGEMDEREKDRIVRAKRAKSIQDVLEEVEVLIDVHFYDEFSATKSSLFLKKIVSNQGSVEISLFKKTWRTLNCSPKTSKIIREIQENLLCVGKRR